MAYLIKLEFNQPIPYYVRINEDNSWKEIYNPQFATYFNNSETALNWMRDNTNLFEYAHAVDSVEANKKFQEWSKHGMVRREFPAIDRKFSRKYDPQKNDRISVLQWYIDKALNSEDNILYSDSRTWPSLYSLFKHLNDIQVFARKNNVKTIGCQISVSKKADFETFKDEIDLIIERIDVDEDGDLRFPILDDDLSRGGSRYLIKCKDGSWEICSYYGSRMLEDANLEDCFKYIQEHFSYS